MDGGAVGLGGLGGGACDVVVGFQVAVVFKGDFGEGVAGLDGDGAVTCDRLRDFGVLGQGEYPAVV